MTAIALLLFVGATGKSAQIPLYVWLPDAMEGPTPVSALIHAATMVTAGVYMVTRMNAVFQLAPVALAVVATVGAVTAIFAATMGLVQNDIKRVLAYSTVSQLGYMFLALGVGAFTAGIFHLMTHAFFKALLFLGSGSVIHAMSGEQDMRKMGALWSKIPITFVDVSRGHVAISGIPPLAGFVSKDAILARAFDARPLLWVIGFITAGMTAFYMFRLVYMTFFGESRVSHEAEHHIHESPPLDDRAADDSGGALDRGRMDWLAGSAGRQRSLREIPRPGDRQACGSGGRDARSRGAHHRICVDGGFGAGGALRHLPGVAVSICRSPAFPARWRQNSGGVYRLLYNKYYVDQIYDAMFVNRAKDLGIALGAFDRGVINGLGVDGAGWLTRASLAVSMMVWDKWIDRRTGESGGAHRVDSELSGAHDAERARVELRAADRAGRAGLSGLLPARGRRDVAQLLH